MPNQVIDMGMRRYLANRAALAAEYGGVGPAAGG